MPTVIRPVARLFVIGACPSTSAGPRWSAAANAVVHRDYEARGSQIIIRLFPGPHRVPEPRCALQHAYHREPVRRVPAGSTQPVPGRLHARLQEPAHRRQLHGGAWRGLPETGPRQRTPVRPPPPPGTDRRRHQAHHLRGPDSLQVSLARAPAPSLPFGVRIRPHVLFGSAAGADCQILERVRGPDEGLPAQQLVVLRGGGSE